MSRLPQKFEELMSLKLGHQFAAFQQSLVEPSPVSIRINPVKSQLNQALSPVPWSQYGQYLASRPVFTLDPCLHAGSYYVQEASSMFLEQAVKQSVDLNLALNVLDLCAAPGGKSTHLLSLLSAESLLVSNDVIRPRASILSENIQKWGYHNVIVTNNDPQDFQALPGFFDLIVVDAPCSGEGLFRKDPAAVTEWSPENVLLCASRQRRIVADVWDTLRENGILIYCTCTYNEAENEDNLRWIQAQYPVDFVNVNTDASWNIERIDTGNVLAYRFFPHHTKGEGFFLSVMRKTSSANKPRIKSKKPLSKPAGNITERLHSWVSKPEAKRFYQFKDLIFFTIANKNQEIEFLLQNLKIVYAGTNMATVKHNKLIPDHALALSCAVNKENFPTAEIPEQKAIQYLRRDVLETNGMPTGFTLLTYKNLPLGWVNVLSNRVNNMYPADWRIRMDPGGNKGIRE